MPLCCCCTASGHYKNCISVRSGCPCLNCLPLNKGAGKNCEVSDFDKSDPETDSIGEEIISHIHETTYDSVPESVEDPYDIDSNARLGLNPTPPLIDIDGDGSNQITCLDRNGADGEGLNQAYLPDFPRLPVSPNFRWGEGTDPHLMLISTMLMKRWPTGRVYQLENLGSLLCQNLPFSLMPMLVVLAGKNCSQSCHDTACSIPPKATPKIKDQGPYKMPGALEEAMEGREHC